MLIAQTADVDDMLTAMGATGANVIQRSLTADEVGSLEASLRSTPLASRGPSAQGEEAVDARTFKNAPGQRS